jgi:preprotein translocase subunit SecE
VSQSEAAQQANRSGMDPRRLVVIFYLVAAFILSLFFEHLLSSFWPWGNPEVIEGLGWTRTTILGVVLAIAIVVGSWFYPPSRQYLTEVSTELMKVTWPSWGETRVSTVAVVVASIISGALLFGIDTAAYRVMVVWLPRLWGKL